MPDVTATDPNLTRSEEEVRRFWQWYRVPEAVRTSRRGGMPYRLMQQPLAAAGQAWRDQVQLLVTADLMARYHTLRGRLVAREAGWSCHGLPVEVAVESLLQDVPRGYGLERFNSACQQAAAEGLRQAESWAERLAVWLDPDLTTNSMAPQSIAAVWGVLRRLWDAGKLQENYAVLPVCPRCATPLSSPEASHRRHQGEAQEVWVRLPWDGEPDTYFLAWTQSPWMLVGMIALAVHPEIDYVLVELIERPGVPPTRLALAETALPQASLGQYRVLKRLTGKSLRGTRYRPLFTFLPAERGVGRVVLSTQVSVDCGTGVSPVTPAFDGPSLAIAQAHALQVPNVLDDRGNLADSVTPWRGLAPLDAERFVTEDLRARGLIYRQQAFARDLAACPYCGTALLPQARSVWQMETGSGSRIISRDRAWGAPLPVWRCDKCGTPVCVAGVDDLAHRVGQEASQLDLHRPSVDRLVLACAACGGSMHRVPAVLDATFEMAVLSLALAPQAGPADLAVGLDTGQDWLTALSETAALLAKGPALRQSLILPAQEEDEAWDPSRSSLSDALRWAAYANTTPVQAERSFVRPLWRLLVALSGPTDGGGVPAFGSAESTAELQAMREVLGRWLRARIHQAVRLVSDALDAADPLRAVRELTAFVAEATDWYPSPGLPGSREVVDVVSLLIAPFVPHLAEASHRQAGLRGVESVHLGAWPSPSSGWEDREILADMDQVRKLATLSRAIRERAGIPTDLLLPRAMVGAMGDEAASIAESACFQALLARALLVGEVEVMQDLPAQVTWRLGLSPHRDSGRSVDPALLQAALSDLSRAAATEMVRRLWARYSVGVEVCSQMVTVLPDEVDVGVQALRGWIAAAEPGRIVALEIGQVAQSAPLE